METNWKTLEEVAEHLQLGRTKLYRLAQEGKIPTCKVGGQYRFDIEEINSWIRHQRVGGPDYIHGYSLEENTRLLDQAGTLADLLHHDTRYAKGEKVLEAGCGVGAQTVTLAGASPETFFVSVDVDEGSLAKARERVEAAGHNNVLFQQGDLFGLAFEADSFDHVFICFVLEHLRDPGAALAEGFRVLKPGGTLTVIEGDHGSAYFHPRSAEAVEAIGCQVTLQAMAGGNALIGRTLYPLLAGAGFGSVRVSPRVVYVDASKPRLAEGFTRKTFTAMIRGIRAEAVGRGLIGEEAFDKGVADLERAAGPGGTFNYTFFKAVGVKPAGEGKRKNAPQ